MNAAFFIDAKMHLKHEISVKMMVVMVSVGAIGLTSGLLLEDPLKSGSQIFDLMNLHLCSRAAFKTWFASFLFSRIVSDSIYNMVIFNLF